MPDILQKSLPADMLDTRPLPGVQPVNGPWLRVDDAYAGQMALREELLAERREDVLWLADHAMDPARELLNLVVEDLITLGARVEGKTIIRPDGCAIPLDPRDPLGTLGRLVQCDFCLLERAGAEHVLQGAILCFSASWKLSEKIGRPLTAIHEPVAAYDADLARRVQRLFDGVQVGRPLWRFNRLSYHDAALHQPRSASARRPMRDQPGPYLRCERQTVLRLPQTRWVVFAIHTYVVETVQVMREHVADG